MSKKIDSCRICTNHELVTVLDLGTMELTGVFPSTREEKITSGPLRLVKCCKCGLAQLDHNFPLTEMYGDNYGYRSGLNSSMVKHLELSVKNILSKVSLQDGDLVLDIGSNDGTLLGFYPEKGISVVGMDPTIKKFGNYYKEHIHKIPDFFSKDSFHTQFPGKKAKVITSFSMFYDLEQPQTFVNEIKSVLAKDGLWVFEQSYLPLMIERLSYDTVCHEHLEYYCIKQVKWMLDLAEMEILDIDFNDVNGGSFVVYASHKQSSFNAKTEKVEALILKEHELGFSGLEVFRKFGESVANSRLELNRLLDQLINDKKKIVALGASTKGNVLLQYCNLNDQKIAAVGEVNPFKFGKFTPKTKIPIVSESEIEKMDADYKLILPWHFRETFIKREEEFLKNGGKLIFPLPKLEIYDAQG